MRRFVVRQSGVRQLGVAVVGLAVVSFVALGALPAAAATTASGAVSGNDYVTGGCGAGLNADRFAATLIGTSPVGGSLAAMILKASHSCSNAIGSVALSGTTMSGAAIVPSCAGTSFAKGAATLSLTAVCQSGTSRFRLQVNALKNPLAVINGSSNRASLIGVPGWVGTYTVSPA